MLGYKRIGEVGETREQCEAKVRATLKAGKDAHVAKVRRFQSDKVLVPTLKFDTDEQGNPLEFTKTSVKVEQDSPYKGKNMIFGKEKVTYSTISLPDEVDVDGNTIVRQVVEITQDYELK